MSVRTRKQIAAAISQSEAAARQLTEVGMFVEVTRKGQPSFFTWTTSLPWQLGHGGWVVKLEGRSGGYDCALVTPLRADETVWTKVEFEDAGQDLVAIYIGDGKVEWVELGSLQRVFEGKRVCNVSKLKVGGAVILDDMTIRYPIAAISTVRRRVVIGAILMHMMNRKEVAA